MYSCDYTLFVWGNAQTQNIVLYKIFALQKVEEEHVQGTETHIWPLAYAAFYLLTNFLVSGISSVIFLSSIAKTAADFFVWNVAT